MPPDAPSLVGVIGGSEATAGLRRRLDAAGVRVQTAEPVADGDVPRAAIATLAASHAAIVTVLAAESAMSAALAACAAAHTGDLVVLDLSPIAPSMQRDLAVAARASGVALIGGRMLTRICNGASSAKLYVDDDATEAEPLRGVLAAFGDDVVTTGSAGRAKALGLVDDLLANVNAAVVGEALALGRSAGLDTVTLIALLQKGSGMTAIMAYPEVADIGAAARCAALARVAGAARQADHSLQFGSIAIGALLAQSQTARASGSLRGAGMPISTDGQAIG